METTIAIALVTGITQALKMAVKIPSRFVPLISIVLGLALISLGNVSLQDTIITGIVVGLSASGLYQVGKKTIMDK